MIDLQSRARLLEEKRMKSVVSGIGESIAKALATRNDNTVEKSNDGYTINMKVKEEANTEQLQALEKLGKGLALVIGTIKSVRVQLPKIYQVQGEVGITDMPPVRVENLRELEGYFKELSQRVGQLAAAISLIPQQKVEVPKINLPKFDITPLSQSLKELEGIISQSSLSFSEDTMLALKRIEDAVITLANRPQMTAQPVTHISLNSLAGSILTTQIQLGSTITALPAVALANRRSLQIYNNGSNTIYLGGANVSSSNGIPLGAGAFSDGFDFGTRTTLYGISQAGQNNDIRVMEVSDESSGR